MRDEPYRLLLVDDDRDYSDATAVFLRARGYDVVQVFSGADGLRSARLQRPDLILMDIMMGERTEGLFTVQRFRRDEALCEIPILVVSSLYGDVSDFRVDPEPGWTAADDFLPKPVDPDALLHRIQERLAGSPHEGARRNGEWP